jgi:5-methylthioadenosine/S-adenosylhomocysteine deaminase
MGAGMLLTMDDAGTRLRRGAIAIIGDIIAEVGTLALLQKKYAPQKLIYHENAVLIPGLINAHSHETLTRGLHEDLPLMRWLEEVCYPIEGAYTPNDMYAAAIMNQLELIRGGVTTSIDIFRFAGRAIEVAKQSGLRMTFTPQFFDETADRLESIDKTITLIERYHDSENGRIRVWFGPHSPYSCGPETYRQAAALSKELSVGVHTHLCETKNELEIIRKRYDMDPVEYLDWTGVLDVPCVLAHAIHLSDDNIALLARKNRTAGLVYNPISNMKLADGVCRVPELLNAGCTLGLGTDSNLSNNALDMFAEMRIGGYLQKIQNDDATVMPCYEMLTLATRGSAKALHMDDLIGSLKAGKKADAVIVSFARPHMWPVYYENPSNIVEQIVYAGRASDVVVSVVDGRLLMEDYKILTLDEGAAFEQVQRQASDLYKRSFAHRH